MMNLFKEKEKSSTELGIQIKDTCSVNQLEYQSFLTKKIPSQITFFGKLAKMNQL